MLGAKGWKHLGARVMAGNQVSGTMEEAELCWAWRSDHLLPLQQIQHFETWCSPFYLMHIKNTNNRGNVQGKPTEGWKNVTEIQKDKKKFKVVK